MRGTQHFHHGLLLSTPKEKKRNYLHRKAPNKQKEEQEIFWGFFLITTTISMESKLAKSYNYFFWFLLRLFQTHKLKA